MELNNLAKLCQHCTSRNPTVILGSGASVPHGISGMDALTTFLREEIDADDLEQADWRLVIEALDAGDHLEAALDRKPLLGSLVEKIVRSTWNFIEVYDHELFISALSLSYEFPLSKLFQALLNTTHSTINVVTTNYDRVAEYAADKAGLLHINGFSPGYIRREEHFHNLRTYRGNHPVKSVRLWKVHGSIDWFSNSDAISFSAPITKPLPHNLTPLIVTPGVSKYQRTHDEPFRSAIQGADRALKNAGAFLCIGYGFRDSHIHPKLVQRCRFDKMPILIIARTLTMEARLFIKANTGPHFVALEQHESGTRVFSHLTPEGFVIPETSLWRLDDLNELCGF